MGFLNNKLLPFIYSGAHLVFKINKDQNVCNKSKPFVTANFLILYQWLVQLTYFGNIQKQKYKDYTLL